MRAWPRKPIGELCDLINGRAFKPSDWGTEGLPIVRIQNLNDQSKPYNKFKGQYSDKHFIDNGDILLSWSGTPGTSFGCFRWMRGPGLLNQHIFKVIVESEIIDGDFFIHAVNSRLEEMIGQAHGGVGLRHITKSKLEAIHLPVPKLEEQRRIAARIKACLERVEEIEGLRANATEEVEGIIKSILYETWQSSVIATVKKIPLSELGSITTGNTPSRKVPEYFGGHQPWVTPGDFNGRLITTGREFLSKRGISESNVRIVSEGSVLVVCIGATIGKIALAGCDLGINQQINAVTFNLEKVIPEFGYWACRALVPEIIDNASKNTLPILNKGRFSKLKIPVPNKEAQESIAAQLNAAEAAVLEMRQELLKANAASTALRESILRKAFAGEI